jgi:dehydrogenase/reductase SDR family protein 7
LVVPLDVLDFPAHGAAFQSMLQQVTKLDVLVLNVGRTQRSLAEDTPLQVTRDMIELNVLSQINMAKVVLPHFLERRAGTFLLTSSVAGKVGAPIISSYNLTKHAVQGFFDSLRLETCDRGVNVCIACPGPVATPIEAAAFCERVGEKLGTTTEDLSKKMPVSRCARLMLTQVTNRIDESWISQNPVLIFSYLTQYAPDVARFVGKRLVGPARVAAFRRGEDVYSSKALGLSASGAHEKKGK